MLSRMKFDIDDIVTKKLDALPKTIWTSKTTRFLDPAIGGGQYVRAIEQRLRDAGHSTANIRSRVFGYEQSSLYIRFAVNKYNLVGQYVEMPYDEFFELDTTNMKKFDVVVGNPPYQRIVGPGKTEAIWPAFVQKAFELATPDGYVALIHPSGWRNVKGNYSPIKDLYNNKTLNYLSIHNVKNGMKTFGAGTRYDLCIAQNTDSTSKHLTAVRFEDGVTQQVNLKKLPFIPNCDLDTVMKVVAKPGEETVEVLYSSSAYETRAKWVSKTKTAKHKYPIVYLVHVADKVSYMYSSINTNNHFGTPKLIWSNGPIKNCGSIIDAKGKYGITQFAYAIVDAPKNLPLIKKAFDSKEFRNLMKACSVGQNYMNHKVISIFRKDFWKIFV